MFYTKNYRSNDDEQRIMLPAAYEKAPLDHSFLGSIKLCRSMLLAIQRIKAKHNDAFVQSVTVTAALRLLFFLALQCVNLSQVPVGCTEVNSRFISLAVVCGIKC